MYNAKTELKTAKDLVPEFIRSKILAKEHPLSFGMPKIDDILDGDLRGKIAAIIGYAGTKKSLFAFNMCMKSSTINRSRAIYSTMEMSYNAMMSRVIDYSVDPIPESQGMNMSKYLKSDISKETESFYSEQLTNVLNESYGDYLLFNQKNGMTYKDYKELIRIGKEKHNNIDILIVDGLSMMGGVGTERDKTDENTMMLKELSKEEDVFIPIIVHASRGETKHTRDLSGKARGSEKIMDNVDMCFTLSLIQEDSVANTYYNNEGYIRMWDKRGTGIVEDVIFDFDPRRLRMTESHKLPRDVEISDNRF